MAMRAARQQTQVGWVQRGRLCQLAIDACISKLPVVRAPSPLGRVINLLFAILLTPAGLLVPLDMCGSMALVQLPPHCTAAAQAAGDAVGSGDSGMASAPTSPAGATSADAKWVQDCLHYQHRIEVPVKCVAAQLYVRISVHIYNELPDYERLAAAVGAITQQGSGANGGHGDHSRGNNACHVAI